MDNEATQLPGGERFRMIADMAPVMIWMSGADKLCYFVNRGWLDFTGRSEQEELGDGWMEGIHPDDLAHCTDIYTESFDQGVAFRKEYRLRRHDGQYRWVLDSGRPCYDAAGHFAGYIGSCIDIHEMKEIDMMKDQFVSMAGHELRTPLTTVKTALQVLYQLHRTNRESDKVPQLFQSSLAGVRKLERLINELLNVSVINEGRLHLKQERFNLASVVERCQEYIRATTDKRLEVQGRVAWEIYADPDKVEMVLTNLVNNAAKYASESEVIHIAAQPDGAMLRVQVKDYGPGIAATQLPLLFERYYRAEQAPAYAGGFGLGLFIARELIVKHGGEIGVDSTPGSGATFWFTLPLVQP